MLKVLLALKNPDPAVDKALEKFEVDPLPAESSLLDRVNRNSYHLILLEDTVEMVSTIKDLDPRAEIILVGKQESTALEAIKNGAAAYLKTPVDPELLIQTIDKIDSVVQLRRETGELEKRLIDKYTFQGITGKNPQMLEVFSFIRRIAPYYQNVLISGETGTGKEVIAKALHASSPWAKHPFLVCNCGAFVENLIESELFGHRKGAFTGADKDKTGLFEAAGEGTLFLDEIGELPMAFQPHFLRVLQNGEFRPVGSNKTYLSRCRIIAATNRDLSEDVKAGRFREDLYFRLTPLTIQVPPLRERKDDLSLLFSALLKKFTARTGKQVYGISRPAQGILMAHSWPGNVRELENVLERAAILTSETFIRADDLPKHLKTPATEAPAPFTLKEMEKNHIEKVLQRFNGNRTRASAALGVSRRALIRRIEKLGIQY